MFLLPSDKCPCGVVANVLDCNIVVSKFELQSCYYIHLWTNTLEKDINSFITHPQ